jgi:hypothetical protein
MSKAPKRNIIPPTKERTGRQSISNRWPATISHYIDRDAGVGCSQTELDRTSLDRSLGLSALGGFAGCSTPLAGTYHVYRQMSSDPTFALAIAAANSPILGAGWGWEAKDDVPDDTVDLIKGIFDGMIRTHVVRECLRAREFGWRGMEKVFHSIDGVIRFRKIKPLWPDRTKILIDSESGEFAGFTQDGITLELERCFLYTHAIDCDDYYGHALHENGLRAWTNWLSTIESGGRLQSKVSGIIVQIHYPAGASDDQTKSTREIAQKILNDVSAGKSVAMPNLFYAGNGIQNMADLAGKSQWVLSTLDTGNSQGAQATIETDRRYWDVQKLRAWGVPERVVTEGQFGTKAEAESHADILLANAQIEHQNIVNAVNKQLVDDILIYNRGESARGSVWAVAQPIIDEKRAVLKEFLVSLWTNPATLELLLSGGETGKPVDVDAVLDQFGFPRTEIARDTISGIVANPQSATSIPAGVQNRISNLFDPADITTTIDTNPAALADVQLNGAQIASVVDVMNQVRNGSIVPNVAVELLVAVGLPRDRAKFMIQATDSAPPINQPTNQ